CKDSTILSTLSLQNFKTIKPFNNTKEIIICLGKDDIVINPNIFQAIEHFKAQGLDVSVRVPELSDGKSISFQELLHSHGRDAVSNCLNKPMDISKTNDNVIALSSKGKTIEHENIISQKQSDSIKQENTVQTQRQQQVNMDRQMMR
ncbi:MAG: hypothetical protein HRT87_07125, partial [Legionellales bacterium]|nr:hypothetical protein [Legionellales bacterium]